MGWGSKEHNDEATRLLAKADQHAAAGNAKAAETLHTSVEAHRRFAAVADTCPDCIAGRNHQH